MDLFRFDYEVSANKSRWKINIVGNDPEEASNFLRKIVGTPINIFSIESAYPVNGITDEIVNKIISIYNKNSETEDVKILEVPKNTEKVKKVRMKRKETK